MGVNEAGVFVGITNLWTGEPPDPRRLSRGLVVVRLLASRNLEEVEARIASSDARETNPYLVACADTGGRGMWAATAEGLQPHSLEEGIHAFGNLLPELTNEKEAIALRRTAEKWRGRRSDMPREIMKRLAEGLASHEGQRGPRESLCVHTAGSYGTVSSTILLAGPDLGSAHLYYASGPPCVTPFEDLTAVVRELGKASRTR